MNACQLQGRVRGTYLERLLLVSLALGSLGCTEPRPPVAVEVESTSSSSAASEQSRRLQAMIEKRAELDEKVRAEKEGFRVLCVAYLSDIAANRDGGISRQMIDRAEFQLRDLIFFRDQFVAKLEELDPNSSILSSQIDELELILADAEVAVQSRY